MDDERVVSGGRRLDIEFPKDRIFLARVGGADRQAARRDAPFPLAAGLGAIEIRPQKLQTGPCFHRLSGRAVRPDAESRKSLLRQSFGRLLRPEGDLRQSGAQELALASLHKENLDRRSVNPSPQQRLDGEVLVIVGPDPGLRAQFHGLILLARKAREIVGKLGGRRREGLLEEVAGARQKAVAREGDSLVLALRHRILAGRHDGGGERSERPLQ